MPARCRWMASPALVAVTVFASVSNLAVLQHSLSPLLPTSPRSCFASRAHFLGVSKTGCATPHYADSLRAVVFMSTVMYQILGHPAGSSKRPFPSNPTGSPGLLRNSRKMKTSTQEHSVQAGREVNPLLLRPRQQETLDKVQEALDKHNNTLVLAPTGFGKTVTFCAIVKKQLETRLPVEAKVCILSHLQHLTKQNSDTFQLVAPGTSVSFYDAGEKSWQGQVVFAMIQSLSRGNLDLVPFLDMIVIDEAHHSTSSSYQAFVAAVTTKNPRIRILGVTATASRSDRKPFPKYFDNVADYITLCDTVAAGHLVWPRTVVVNTSAIANLRPLLENVSLSVSADNGVGEFNLSQVSKIMDHIVINQEVVNNWKKVAEFRQTVGFCSTVEHANSLCTTFVESGVRAVVVSSNNMTEAARRKALQEYASGAYKVILCVAVLIEGWDDPPTSCVLLLRPSSCKATMLQMIGRGLRKGEAWKEDCIIMDFGTSIGQHGRLEDEVVMAAGRRNVTKADMISCEGCSNEIPFSLMECPFCGRIRSSISSRAARLVLEDAPMIEIDMMIEGSRHIWIPIDVMLNLSQNDQPRRGLMASTNNLGAWAAVVLYNDTWYAIGGVKQGKVMVNQTLERVHLLLGGKKKHMALSAAIDFLNRYETVEGWQQSQKWRYEKPTGHQIKLFQPEWLKAANNMTRGEACAFSSLRINLKDIRKKLGCKL